MNRIVFDNKTKFLIYIYKLSDQHQPVRSIDLAKQMGLSKASISMSLNKLVECGLVQKEFYGDIFLSDKGQQIAEKLYQEHCILNQFFKEKLHNTSDQADYNSLVCLSTFSQECIDQFIEYIKTN